MLTDRIASLAAAMVVGAGTLLTFRRTIYGRRPPSPSLGQLPLWLPLKKAASRHERAGLSQREKAQMMVAHESPRTTKRL
jgi:hypothetical protein